MSQMFCVVTSLKCLALNAYSGYLYDYYTFLDGQINRHRCTDSPLFDAHECWLGQRAAGVRDVPWQRDDSGLSSIFLAMLHIPNG